jgi:copper chaperone NosL
MIRTTAILVVAAILLGCSRRQADLTPPELQLGQIDCAQCGMTVSDDRYAAAAIVETSAGDRLTKIFDDVGCLAAYEREQHDGTVLARYVKDYNTRAWLKADQAFYVRARSIQSPMGYGLLATADTDAAHTIAGNKNGKVTRFLDIQAAPAAAASAR